MLNLPVFVRYYGQLLMKQYDSIGQFIKNNAMQLTMQVFSLAFLLLSLYLTTRIAPLQQDIALIRQRVEAVENISKDRVSRGEFYKAYDDMKNQLDFIIQLHVK